MPRRLRVNNQDDKIIPQATIENIVNLRKEESKLKDELKKVKEKLEDAEESVIDRLNDRFRIAQGRYTARVEQKDKKNSVSWKTEFITFVGNSMYKNLRRSTDILKKIAELTGTMKKAKALVKKHADNEESAYIEAAGKAEADRIAESQEIEQVDILVIE